MSTETDIFTKITDKERQRLLKDLCAVRGEILGKGQQEAIHRLIAERTTPRQELICSVMAGLPTPQEESEIFANFYLGGERYFFKTPMQVNHDQIILRADTDLFHLQRRQNYRIKIPTEYPAQMQIVEINGEVSLQDCHILDLSGGGCKLALDKAEPALKPGDRFLGVLKVGVRDTLEIEGIIRHYKLEKSAIHTRQLFGVEFQGLSPILEGKIFAMTMDLHREFFNRFGRS